MTTPTTIEVFVVIDDGTDLYYLLKVQRRGFDVYCYPPHFGAHYSLHESGEAHLRSEKQGAKLREELPVILMDGDVGTPFRRGDVEGIIRETLCDIGRASGIFTTAYSISSLSSDYHKFDRSPKECFVIDARLFAKDISLVEIGVWAVPERNKVSFDQNIPNIPDALLYKVVQCEPQIWIYARPFV